MGNSKYSGVLTVILIIAILAIIGLLIYVGVDWYVSYTRNVNAQDAANRFDDFVNNSLPHTNNEQSTNVQVDNSQELNITIENTVTNETVNNTTGGNSNNNGSSNKKPQIGGYDIIGTIEIPKTKIKYPIVDSYTPEALNVAICKLYGPGPNEVGNTVLIGHNYKNGTFFSNNNRLSKGDKIYITDSTGKKVTYEISNIYNTDTHDFKYANRETNGKRAISLSTCTNDTNSRLIIWAEEK